ncbi:MAG TPA: response regulator [Oxalicibacterium sp.]|uniref:response regulator n=1 Tax=Oxalicibacterium sp. TaxID=2766525 RepID=UPI002B8F8F9F|nr:response regulator [Oxalicibacterium sp.]HWU97964.1 response regulator [Oxalicibacterium sp.]
MQSDETGKTGRRLRVLLVEDNVDALEGLVEMTGLLGHDAHGCTSAENALSMLKGDQAFDLMITDIGLPGISGLELARQVRALRPLEITVASGYARSNDVPSDVGWLMKPFGIEEYAALLDQAAQR